MSSTSNDFNSRLYDPSQPPSTAGTAVGTVTPPSDDQSTTGPILPQRSEVQEVQDIQTQQAANEFNSEPPLDVRPTSEGGVGIGGQSSIPQGKVSFTDKIIGKTEKVIGKTVNDPERYQRGELRETGGKAAAEDRARAAYD